jgi:hypothetical protein
LENLKRVFIRSASAAKATMSGTRGRLYLYNTLLEGLAYNLKHIAFEFAPLVWALKPATGQGFRFRGGAADCRQCVLEILRRLSEDGLIYI